MDKPEKIITIEQAFAQMARLCSRKECCVWDVRQKLKRMSVSEEAAGAIIDRLKKGRYIDEARYTRNYIHDKLTFNKWGRMKIVLSLRQKQIPAEVIDAAFEEFTESQLSESLRNCWKPKKNSQRKLTLRNKR